MKRNTITIHTILKREKALNKNTFLILVGNIPPTHKPLNLEKKKLT
jgi:hypothetical protein